MAVLFHRAPEPAFEALPLELEGEIDRLLGRTVQVVGLNTAPADLRVRVLRDGVLLLDRETSTNRELFDRLETAGWLEPRLAGILRNLAGFRNVLVHGYDTVDLAVVRDIVEHRLDDLLEFAASVRGRLPES